MKRVYFYNPLTQKRAYGHIPADVDEISYIQDVMFENKYAYFRDNANDSFSAWTRYYAYVDFVVKKGWTFVHSDATTRHFQTITAQGNTYTVIYQNGMCHIYRNGVEAIIAIKNEYEALQFAHDAKLVDDENDLFWKRD